MKSKTAEFVRSVLHRESRALFELLPPQRAALLEQGLVDQEKTAVVVDLPTSAGNTLLAQFRILQEPKEFGADEVWVAHVEPARALVARVTRRLRREFDAIKVGDKQLTAAVDDDAREDEPLQATGRKSHVLVATPEKLSLVVRNDKVAHSLALSVMDESHNLEAE